MILGGASQHFQSTDYACFVFSRAEQQHQRCWDYIHCAEKAAEERLGCAGEAETFFCIFLGF